MITHNHESFIKQAIESVLEQQCNFNVELIVVDDCSTDSTQKEIESVLRTDPKSSLIKYIRHSKNIGMMPNFYYALKKCKGKYIALCDGDDYWTNPHKLQKQVDFLEKNKEYVAYFHNAKVLREGNFYRYENDRKTGNVSNEEIILKGGGVYPTASLLYKNILEFPKLNFNLRAGDSLIVYSLLNKGKIFYYENEMCVYRKHSQGVFSSLEESSNAKGVVLDIISNIRLLNHFKNKSVYKNLYFKAINNQFKRLSNRFSFLRVLKLTLINNLRLKNFIKFYLKKNKIG